MMPPSTISTVFFFLFLPIITGFAESQPVESDEVVALVITFAPDEEQNTDFEKFLTASLEFELRRVGMKVISGTALELFGESDPTSEQVLGSVKMFPADFVVTERYTFRGDQFQIDLSLYDVEQEALVTSVLKKGPVGLTSDVLVAEAVEEMLSGAGEQLEQVLAAAVEAAMAFAAAAAATAAAATSDETEMKEPETEVEPLAAVEPAVMLAAVQRVRRLEFGAGFSIFLAVGKAGEYFDLGYSPSIYGSLRFNMRAGLLGVGLYSGVNLFQVSGELTSTQVQLLPIGLDLRFVVGEDRLLGVLIHINGGAALLIMSTEQSGTQSKALPYVQGGLGLILSFAPFMGLILDISYGVYFEESYPIMGFTPSLYLSIRV